MYHIPHLASRQASPPALPRRTHKCRPNAHKELVASFFGNNGRLKSPRERRPHDVLNSLRTRSSVESIAAAHHISLRDSPHRSHADMISSLARPPTEAWRGHPTQHQAAAHGTAFAGRKRRRRETLSLRNAASNGAARRDCERSLRYSFSLFSRYSFSPLSFVAALSSAVSDKPSLLELPESSSSSLSMASVSKMNFTLPLTSSLFPLKLS